MERVLLIRYLRLKYHISLQELADAARTNHQLISKIELGREPPAQYHMRRLQRGMEVLIRQREEDNQRLAEEYSANRLTLFDTVEVDL